VERVTLLKKTSNLEQRLIFEKNGSHLEIWVTVRKMGYNSESGSHLKKLVKLTKKVTLAKNGSNLENRVRLK